jgi:WD40 repeat protein
MSNPPPHTFSVISCAKCGKVLPTGRLDGHCPSCLIATSVGNLFDDAPEPGTAPEDDQPWIVLGDCELFGELGHGGMGVVYRARQRRLRRSVAVKVLRGGKLAEETAKARFRAEAENAARLKHPGIVAIHEIGEEQGICWFAMDLVEGGSLDHIIRDQPMGTRAAAQCVAKIADAVQHAHDHGVLHRDLKPPNILLDFEGEPHITDFGIARRIELDGELGNAPLTQTGQLLGSPGYAAPEQALFGNADVRTDVYGLGAILYHLLAGRPPFQGPTMDVVLLQLREGEPLSPRRLNPSVPRDVETICLKCLSRDPGKRYQTAAELKTDLQRWLDGRPIVGRPVSLVEKTWRWMKRRPGTAALLSLMFLGTAGAFYAIDQSRRQESAARINEASARMDEAAAKVLAENRNAELRLANQRTRDVLDTTELGQAEEWFRTNQRDRGLEALARVLRRSPDHPVASARLGSALLHGGAVMPVLWPMIESEEVIELFLCDEGKRILVCHGVGAVMREADTGKELRRYGPTPGYVDHFALSPDGKTLCGWHRNPGSHLTLWSVETSEKIKTIYHTGGLQAVFTPDSKFLLANITGNEAHLLDTATGERTFPAFEHPAPVSACGISPDGRFAATASTEDLFLWNLPERRLVAKLPQVHNTCQLVFSRDGNLLAAGTVAGELAVFPTNGEQSAIWKARHGDAISSIRFSPGGNRLLTASHDNTSALWQARTGIPIRAAMTHEDHVGRAIFDPDGSNFICTTSSEGTARLWDANTGRALAQPLQHGERVNAAAFDQDKSTLYTTGAAGAVSRWNILPAAPYPIRLEHQANVVSAAWAADGKQVATTSHDKNTILWDATTGAKQLTSLHRSQPRFVTFPPKGSGLLVICELGGSTLKALTKESPDIATYTVRDGGEQLIGAFSKNAEFYAAGTADGRFYAWDTVTKQLLFPPILPPVNPSEPEFTAIAVEFSADASRLLTVASSGSTKFPYEAVLRHVPSGRIIAELVGHEDDLFAGCFSSDGKLIATASNDNTVRLWDGLTGKFTGSVLRHFASVKTVAFQPGGNLLATGSNDRKGRIWNVQTGQLAAPILLHQNHVNHVGFSPNGKRLVTCGADGNVRIWDVATGLPLSEALPSDGEARTAAFSPAADRLLVRSENRAARIWETPEFPTAPEWAIELAEILTFREFQKDPTKMLALIARYQRTLGAMGKESTSNAWGMVAARLLARPVKAQPSPGGPEKSEISKKTE